MALRRRSASTQDETSPAAAEPGLGELVTALSIKSTNVTATIAKKRVAEREHRSSAASRRYRVPDQLVGQPAVGGPSRHVAEDPIEVAVLRCVVDGIGGASHADDGITGAKGGVSSRRAGACARLLTNVDRRSSEGGICRTDVAIARG